MGNTIPNIVSGVLIVSGAALGIGGAYEAVQSFESADSHVNKVVATTNISKAHSEVIEARTDFIHAAGFLVVTACGVTVFAGLASIRQRR